MDDMRKHKQSIDPNDLARTAVQTFSDEFDSLSLYDGTSGTWETTYPWSDRSGNGGTLNDEQQWYINSLYAPTASIRPWEVKNGNLVITADRSSAAIKPLINGYEYTSGVLTTYKSFNQLYGYFECSAKLPKGQGFWPAFWMDQQGVWEWPEDPTKTWPPEFDIFEVLCKDTTTLYQTVHTSPQNVSLGKVSTVPDMSAAFHTYGFGWWKDFIIFYFDRIEMHRVPTPTDCHQPMFLMLNLALGGGWGGPVDETTPFPAQMLVDYVRVYKSADGAELAPPPSGTTPPVTPPVTPPSSGLVLSGQLTGSDGSIWDATITKR